MNKISSSRPLVSLQASNTGQKDNLEAMQSTKLDAKIFSFFQLTSDHFIGLQDRDTLSYNNS